MPLRSKTTILLALAAVAALAQTPAQQKPPAQAPAPASDDVVLKVDTTLVPLHVSVLDRSGKLLTSIPRTAFHVFENKDEQTIKQFLREDVPVSMGIIIDNSGSMREKRTRVAAASLALVKASNPDDEMFIVNFNDDAYLDLPFTNDIKKMEETLDKIDTKGGTAMRDAISMSLDYAKSDGKRDKKVLLVITDGNDNTSNMTLEQLVRKAQQSGVLIYCIGLLNEEDPREAHKAKRALKALAEASGGLDYYAKDLAEVEKITPQVANEIRRQYLITYSPTNDILDGTFRQIRVIVKGFGNPTVRTRNGYYATPQPASKPGAPKPSSLVKQ